MTGRQKSPHPGQLLKELMGEAISISTLADHLQATRETVSMILSGRQSISPDMALRLAAAFDTSPEVWMNMQTQYDLLLAEKKDRPSIVSIRKQPVGHI